MFLVKNIKNIEEWGKKSLDSERATSSYLFVCLFASEWDGSFPLEFDVQVAVVRPCV